MLRYAASGVEVGGLHASDPGRQAGAHAPRHPAAASSVRCYAVLCCAVLCCPMLCYAVLCYAQVLTPFCDETEFEELVKTKSKEEALKALEHIA